MTYQDPKIPDPGLGRDPPRYRDLDTDSFSMGSIITLILGIVLICGVIFYAVNGPSGTTAGNPPTTTGQGLTPVSPPATLQVAPAPAARSTTLPPIDQNVPAEKIAPPIPAEPRIDN